MLVKEKILNGAFSITYSRCRLRHINGLDVFSLTKSTLIFLRYEFTKSLTNLVKYAMIQKPNEKYENSDNKMNIQNQWNKWSTLRTPSKHPYHYLYQLDSCDMMCHLLRTLPKLKQMLKFRFLNSQHCVTHF